MLQLSNKTAIVSGGARGIGAACVRALADAGAHVLIGDVLKAEGEALANEIGDAATFAFLNVTSDTDWRSAVRTAQAVSGTLDVLVNSAGIIRYGGIEGQTQDDFRLLIEVNLVGTFLGMQAALPVMRRQGSGSVVNLSSTAGLVGYSGLAGYTASKWGVRGLTKSAALDMSGSGVRVNSVHPGPIRTPMLAAQGDEAAAGQPVERLGEPEEVAALVLFLAGDGASYSTGSEFVADGGAVLVGGAARR
jgi:3alpha(or 20beta)-hydroxysteroid dehydrogenase